MKFSDVVGQESLKARLVRGIQLGKVPHAQFFAGNPGSGNLALALAYATYCLCSNRNENDSCGECPSCQKMASFTHPDVHYTFPVPNLKNKQGSADFYADWRSTLAQGPYFTYEKWMLKLGAENKQGNIAVDECRAIIRNLSMKAFEGGYKILILWQPEYLGPQGNILLKFIEEPPDNTLFLLVGTNTNKVLSTILSRSQLLRVPPVDDESLSLYLQQTQGMDKSNADRVALMSAGSVVKAEELLNVSENVFLQPLREWLNMCYALRMNEALKWADNFGGEGREVLKGFFGYAMEMMRAVAVQHILGERSGLSEQEREFVSRFSKIVHPGKVDSIYGHLNSAYYELERNGQPKYILSDLSFKFSRVIRAAG